MEEQIKILFDDGDEDEVGNPYLYLPLFDGDIGNKKGRATKNEFIHRNPFAVTKFTQNGLMLTIGNSGFVPTDLVMVEYQVVYCTYPGHGAQDGFTFGRASTIHAGEQVSNENDLYLTIDHVPARNFIVKEIRFQGVPDYIDSVYNIYFRAKVSVIWHESVEMKDWDFENDVTVVEAHLRLRP